MEHEGVPWPKGEPVYAVINKGGGRKLIKGRVKEI